MFKSKTIREQRGECTLTAIVRAQIRIDFKGHTYSHFTNNASSVCVRDTPVEGSRVIKNT